MTNAERYARAVEAGGLDEHAIEQRAAAVLRGELELCPHCACNYITPGSKAERIGGVCQVCWSRELADAAEERMRIMAALKHSNTVNQQAKRMREELGISAQVRRVQHKCPYCGNSFVDSDKVQVAHPTWCMDQQQLPL